MTPRQLAVSGLIASSYAVLSLAFHPISFGVYQVRVAEALTVLPFLTVAAVPGLYVGCLLANIFGGMGWLDIVLGPLITLVAAVLTYQAGHLTMRKLVVSAGFAAPLFMWLAAVYLLSEFRWSFDVIVGVVLSVISLVPILLMLTSGAALGGSLQRNFWNVSVVGLVFAVAAIPFLSVGSDPYFLLCGSLLMVAAVFSACVLAWCRITGGDARVLLAPVPPVVLNAIGVSIYLAPIIGVPYWFSVQMIGIGQLIACYVIGLPVLMILRRRQIFG